MREEIQTLKPEISQEIEKNITDQLQDQVRKELREIEDQQRRALNLVIFNLPESNRQTAILRKKHDERKFAELCAQIGVDIPDVTTMFRLGTIKEGANRPLKIILNNKQHRKTILDNASKLRQSKEDTDLKNYIIVKDLTPQQRNYNKLRRLKILSEKKPIQSRGL